MLGHLILTQVGWGVQTKEGKRRGRVNTSLIRTTKDVLHNGMFIFFFCFCFFFC